MEDLFAVFSEEQHAEAAAHIRKLGENFEPPPPAKRRKADNGDGAEEPALVLPRQDEEVTTDIIYENYDEQCAGSGCTHECMLPADFNREASRPAPPSSSTGPAKTYGFPLDGFQREAVKCLEKRESVLVSAHTSAGKTVVAEYAIAMALRDKQRIIYTSPIKALSNQKYRDLQDEFKDVGLMTGDVTVNPHATCMIMTTEILRSMLYHGSEVCREMAWVIWDEVHYMRDRDRGVVWEEAIILLPDTVRLVFLSATIPNAREFAEWICRIKHQPCHVIYTDRRPVPLQHFVYPSGADGVYLVMDEQGTFREDNFHKAIAAMQKACEPQNVDSRKGARRKGGGKGWTNDLEKAVKMCQERGNMPLIIFSFSRKGCEGNAMALKKLDVTTDDDKRLIEEVFQNAIMTLSDEDRELPQVQSMLPLLRRGLGIHHGGLLPMLKEVVEILFQESLVKVLFSTETLSMGINMPAKTVLFTQTRKWDGVEYRMLNAGEYIQMSGRAGRRGKDDRGLSIIMLDEKVEPEVAKTMFIGKSTRISSAFHLGYGMLLNLLRVEGADPDYMIQRSFHQYQKDRSTLDLQERKKDLEAELNNVEDLRSAVQDEEMYEFSVDEAIADYYFLKQEIDKCQEELRQILIKPEHIATFLNPGRLLYFKDGSTDWSWGILVEATLKNNPHQAKHGEEAPETQQWVLDVFMPCEPGSVAAGKPCPPVSDKQVEGHVLPMSLTIVHKISKIRSNMPADDPGVKQEESLKTLTKTLTTIKGHKKFRATGLPELDPRAEMNIQEEEALTLLDRLAELRQRLSEHGMKDNPKISEYCEAFDKKIKLQTQVQELEKTISQSRFMVMGDDLRAMRRVLRRLEFVDKDGIVQLKGRMACELTSADEVLMAEIVFQNVFEGMPANHIVALASCLVFDEKAQDITTSNPELLKAYETMKSIARNVGEVMKESKLPIDVDEYVGKVKPQLIDVVMQWLEGKPFNQIMSSCYLYEGSVVRVLRRLEELIREMETGAKVIGNEELEAKLSEGRSRLKRGIIFAASLYL